RRARTPPGRSTRPVPRLAGWSTPRAGTRHARTAPDRRGRALRRPRSRPRLPGEAEQALAEDVALDLARAALDRVGARRQHGPQPPAAGDRGGVCGGPA